MEEYTIEEVNWEKLRAGTAGFFRISGFKGTSKGMMNVSFLEVEITVDAANSYDFNFWS